MKTAPEGIRMKPTRILRCRPLQVALLGLLLIATTGPTQAAKPAAKLAEQSMH